jgi:hypothetical protein
MVNVINGNMALMTATELNGAGDLSAYAMFDNANAPSATGDINCR